MHSNRPISRLFLICFSTYIAACDPGGELPLAVPEESSNATIPAGAEVAPAADETGAVVAQPLSAQEFVEIDARVCNLRAGVSTQADVEAIFGPARSSASVAGRWSSIAYAYERYPRSIQQLVHFYFDGHGRLKAAVRTSSSGLWEIDCIGARRACSIPEGVESLHFREASVALPLLPG